MERLLPKSFCCWFSLRTGTIFAAVVMLIVSGACVILFSIDLYLRTHDPEPTDYMKRSSSYVIAGILICCFVFFMNIGLIWGVCYDVAHVIFSSCIVQALFLVYLFCSILVLIIMFEAAAAITSFICAVVFYIIFIAIMVYLSLVIFGHWRLLRARELAIKS